jgi:hypothetical protein
MAGASASASERVTPAHQFFLFIHVLFIAIPHRPCTSWPHSAKEIPDSSPIREAVSDPSHPGEFEPPS